ncbi:MAG TPA: GNAT family N-acetyltransferase [Chloroflexota bacterium]|nr:GNAT family N-acetyltransferase [Chloroflexota bacterium]
MNDNREDVVVANNEAEHRYEARVDGELAVIIYQLLGDRIVFIHTEVPEDLEGRGIAGTMARVALDDARARGLAVIPRCPFVAAYIRRHPEYADLVPPEERAQLLSHYS